ncbi:MAG: TetR/AcrR family transcriptional regulator [Scytonematopsis contorta HA4267-MV1]|jgi:AcrR family transcriptional regulator|nr:TetR/AcrR family transcriptional regulator [Scytonematopsis contorta HA4267-MV1]
MSKISASRIKIPKAPLKQKREQILHGAMRVFLQDGYAGTSMDRVSAVAGVSKQTVYSHFQDKEGLFKALMEQVTINNIGSVFGMQELKGEPAFLLRQLAEKYFSLVADNPDYIALLRVIIAESERFPELAKLYTKTVILHGRQLLSQYFLEHSELGISDPEATAQIFFGSLVSYVVTQEVLYGNELMHLSRSRILDNLVNLILKN